MKNLFVSVAMGALVLAGCATVENVETVKTCPGRTACVRPCAEIKENCPFLGKWEFFVEQGDKLAALPVASQPQLELCPEGVMRFHYVKDGKNAVLEGRWQVENDVLAIYNNDASNVQCYILKADGTAVYRVGANDRLPENTKVVLRKVK